MATSAGPGAWSWPSHELAGDTPVSDSDLSHHFGRRTTPWIDIEKFTNGQDVANPADLILPVGSTATFTYMVTNPGGVPLNDSLRLALLLHHWRVANYVNNSDLAEGQYGYPSQFGFAPSLQLSAWQSVGPCGAKDNLIVIPPEITLDAQHLTRDTTLRDARTSEEATYPYALFLTPYGSEYWVIRSDPAIQPFFEMAVGKRPAEELFDIRRDPGCLKNLAGDPAFEPVREKLAKRLDDYLATTGDPRARGNGDVWEEYKRYSPIREFPEPPPDLPG